MRQIKSLILPLPRKDVDTDLIIPAEFLTTTQKKGLGQHVFKRLRQMEADFPFNLEKYRSARILVTGDNFGCGSSREHAPWALKDWGIEVILAPSFANIFYNNALNNGLLCIRIPQEKLDPLLENEKNSQGLELDIHLEDQTVIFPDQSTFFFEINPYKKTCLIEGLEDLDYLLKKQPNIQAFKETQKNTLFIHSERL